MTSPEQIAANRLNAEKSTGPITPEGKARSSRNAFRHGLTARLVVLPTEDMDAYETFSKEIVDSLDAQTPLEIQFAQTVADNQWRINRIRSIEESIIRQHHFDTEDRYVTPDTEFHATMNAGRAFDRYSQTFVNLSIYEQRLHRSQKEALRQLRELQTERRERRKTEMDDAIRLSKMEEMQDLPYDPREDGFVYASREIVVEQYRRERLHLAKIAEQSGFDRVKYNAARSQHPQPKAA